MLQFEERSCHKTTSVPYTTKSKFTWETWDWLPIFLYYSSTYFLFFSLNLCVNWFLSWIKPLEHLEHPKHLKSYFQWGSILPPTLPKIMNQKRGTKKIKALLHSQKGTLPIIISKKEGKRRGKKNTYSQENQSLDWPTLQK